MTDHFTRKIREAHNKMSDYLDDLVQFVNDLSERVDGCADVARKALLQQEKRDWAVDRRIGRLADRVASLEEAADRTPEIGIPTDDGVVDVEIRCGAVYLVEGDEIGCTLTEGHPGDHIATLAWLGGYSTGAHQCGKLLVVMAGGLAHRCTLVGGHPGTHSDRDGCKQNDAWIDRP